jgi:hypothetical protein
MSEGDKSDESDSLKMINQFINIIKENLKEDKEKGIKAITEREIVNSMK